jgi:ceramide glucosyltransferase
MQLAIHLLAIICALLGLSGAAYYAACIWAGRRFQRQGRPRRDFAPPVSILKSLKGVDPHMYAAFRSHCELDYPEYEVLFGVSDPADPSVALVEQLQQEFPAVSLRVVHCPLSLGSNGKVSNLAQMLPQARYEHVLINDSDILVEPDFLRRVMDNFADQSVGMVTTLYRALGGKTLWSRVEALGISTDFMGGVLVAREMEGGIRFALGATMATTKTVLARIGGLEPLAEYLGDDYELGARTASAGYKVALADVVVETALADYSWREFWQHQIRWARNVKDRRKAQYLGLIVTFALAWAIISVAAAPHAWWTWTTLVITALLRFAAALAIRNSVLRDPQVTRDLWLVPLRDFVGLAVWVASFFGDTIVWRGERFCLRNGKLEPLR